MNISSNYVNSDAFVKINKLKIKINNVNNKYYLFNV